MYDAFLKKCIKEINKLGTKEQL